MTEQGFPLCYSPSTAGPGGCHHVDMWEIVVYPMLLYIFWQLLYIAVVRVIIIATCIASNECMAQTVIKEGRAFMEDLHLSINYAPVGY